MAALRVALVLAGGNALGAYRAGVWQALAEVGIEPEWIVGWRTAAGRGRAATRAVGRIAPSSSRDTDFN